MDKNFGFNTGYVEELYAQYLQNPQSVGESWREFFEGYTPNESFKSSVATPEVAPSPEAKETEPVPVRSGDGIPSVRKPVVDIPEDAQVELIKGVASRIVANMDDSLTMPTATSVRNIPVKLMAENRRLINEYQRSRGGAKISFTHLIAWAMVKALIKYPNLYSSYVEKEGKPYHVISASLNLGIAVSVTKKDGSSSLMVPNIKGANLMNFAGFVGAFNDIIRKSRQGNLEVSDFKGTVATLTNPGMIGTVMSVPRLMPGQGVIVATGAIAYPPEYLAIPAYELSRMGISEIMGLTSTYDHRVIQGAESGSFLNEMANLLLGSDKFYHEVFSDLGIPQPPFSLSQDSTPHLGNRTPSTEVDLFRKQAQVMQLIRAYRVRGHLLADTNPLGYEQRTHAELDPGAYGITIWDLDRNFISDGLGGTDQLSLREILDILWETYTRKVGIEYMHITDPMEKRWLQERIEPVRMQEELSLEQKTRILEKLNAAEALEKFIHTKYIGHKRFSLEGGETLIPMLDRILIDAADQEVNEIVIGMAHRGRLNVLANILEKPYEKLFSEFEGYIDPATIQGSGDVKYHLGTSAEIESPSGSKVKVTLSANPSHLEAVDPVVEGMARAIQESYWVNDEHDLSNFDNVIPVLIHGDAAFAGQGVVAETLNLSQLGGYRTGGTIHIVVNNQIGFTTTPEDARSSLYASDIARMIQAPIFHVNGDDPEACVRVARLALDYRQVFNKDVVIDMVCYRLHGHNEGDDPSYTQPILYDKITNHRSVRKLYTELLLRRGDMNPESAGKLLDDFQARLQEAFDRTKSLVAEEPQPVQKVQNKDTYETQVSKEKLDAIVTAISSMPEEVHAHPKLLRQLDRRKSRYFEHQEIDWALGEMMAFGSLLLDGNSVRLSGEDSGRGTFSHRHSVVHDQNSGEKYFPLNHIEEEQALYHVYDSLLSEYAILGFEYGYSIIKKDALVIWEAQFGDFANGGQIIFDQFIFAAEAKWNLNSSLVCLLPHGYEGQGPEHSSARLERFLQGCAEENMFVCNFSTPANYFHALRRQVQLDVPKPLIVMAPKSLLRHKLVISHPEEFTEGNFQPVIPSKADESQVERLIFCSGKVYYDLIEAHEKHENSARIAIARLEQFYPFPIQETITEIERFNNLKEIMWLQEEPENMGAGRFVKPYFNEAWQKVSKTNTAQILYCGRKASASTATGSAKKHATEQEAIVETALTL